MAQWILFFSWQALLLQLSPTAIQVIKESRFGKDLLLSHNKKKSHNEAYQKQSHSDKVTKATQTRSLYHIFLAGQKPSVFVTYFPLPPWNLTTVLPGPGQNT